MAKTRVYSNKQLGLLCKKNNKKYKAMLLAYEKPFSLSFPL